MTQIKVGMLVEIVNHNGALDAGRIFLGHRGAVLSRCSVFVNHWDIEGATRHPSGRQICFESASLRPIPPDESCGKSFREVMDDLNMVTA